jgi:hypothetical protein
MAILAVVALILLAVLALSVTLLSSRSETSSLSPMSSVSASTGPVLGQFLLTSYSFPSNGTSGYLFVALTVYGGQEVTLQSAYFDQTLLTTLNSNLTASCGGPTVGTSAGYQCEFTANFGVSLPIPPTGSYHTLNVVSSAGVASSFQVMVGATYEANTTT